MFVNGWAPCLRKLTRRRRMFEDEEVSLMVQHQQWPAEEGLTGLRMSGETLGNYLSLHVCWKSCEGEWLGWMSMARMLKVKAGVRTEMANDQRCTAPD